VGAAAGDCGRGGSNGSSSHFSGSLASAGEALLREGSSSSVRSQSFKMRSSLRNNKLLVLICTNLANLCCHAVYSVLASFFPQEAKAKGMSDDAVGFVFAVFAGVIFLCSPFAGTLMQRRGKVWVYLCGLALVSVSTILFAAATLVPEGWPFAFWCLTMRLAQGVGSAFEETAMYAIIADLDAENVTFYLGICEISTGLGYMIGPPLGGALFSAGGFATPFIVLGSLVAPAAVLLDRYMPHDVCRSSKDEERSESVSLKALLRNPQVIIMAVAAMLANSDYAFLEPTLGEHASALGVASSPDAIGALFSISMTAYTLSCPVIGILARRERLGSRAVIIIGLLLQLLAFVLIGPSPWLQLERIGTAQMVFALLFFGVGEAMSMTPVMDDMMHSCGEHADEASVSLAPLMASSFSLGQMLGPLLGSSLTMRMGFPWACTLMGFMLLVHIAAIAVVDVVWPRKATRVFAAYTELTEVSVPQAESACD